MSREPTVSDIRLSGKRVGKLYPILLDSDGNVIDGQHRLAADENWPTLKLDYIRSEEERIVARLISNVCRRTVTADEKREMLEKLGEIYLRAGEKPGKIAEKIADEIGMSYRWVMEYLPDKYKEKPGVGGPSAVLSSRNGGKSFYKGKEKFHKSKVAEAATCQLELWLTSPHEEVVVVKNYINADFVNLLLDKRLYSRFEKAADKLGVSSEMMFNNVMLHMLKEIELMLRRSSSKSWRSDV